MSSRADDTGIVTLADANYFQGLLLLYRSVQEDRPTEIACFDIGLTEEQRRAAGALPRLRILPLPPTALVAEVRAAFHDAPALMKVNKRVWPLWLCPALIAAAPFRRVVWLDCDIVVLRNLEQFFVALDDGPIFTPENNAPEVTPNDPELYAHLPIDRPFRKGEPTINAGVSGWDLVRDSAILDAYVHVVQRACEDETVRRLVSWHDQGALIWAIQKCGAESRVAETWAWNLCVKHAPPALTLAFDAAFVPNLRTALPEVNMLHWNGHAPPWINRVAAASAPGRS